MSDHPKPPPRKRCRWPRSHRKLVASLSLLLALVLLNAVAYWQARAMIHFAPAVYNAACLGVQNENPG